jgi:predicted RNA binding protein YcfA (HicA-like mRNA interferase family)
VAKLPRLTALELIKVLEKIGFMLNRQKGSHRVYLDPTGRRIVVPVHAGKTLSPGVVKDALRNAALSVDEFVRLLRGH